MMATTHVLAGMLLGLGVAGLSPSVGLPVVLAGALGGLAPDLDVLGAHRRDLHFPVYGSVLAVASAAVAAVTGSVPAVVAAAFLGGGALHAVSDALGGGRSLRPWAESVDRAVYCHAQGCWWRPRRLIPYDGSPADLVGAIGLGSAVLLLDPTPVVRVAVLALLGVSVLYVTVRRRLPDVVDAVSDRLAATNPSVRRNSRD